MAGFIADARPGQANPSSTPANNNAGPLRPAKASKDFIVGSFNGQWWLTGESMVAAAGALGAALFNSDQRARAACTTRCPAPGA